MPELLPLGNYCCLAPGRHSSPGLKAWGFLPSFYKIIAKRLETYGLSDEKVFSKIEAMSDEQVHQLASLSDRMPAGGDAGVAALIVIVAIAVAIVLLLVLLTLSDKG